MSARDPRSEYGGSMLRWWLDLKWASEVHVDAMAKVRLALLFGFATVLAVAILR